MCSDGISFGQKHTSTRMESTVVAQSMMDDPASPRADGAGQGRAGQSFRVSRKSSFCEQTICRVKKYGVFAKAILQK